MNRFKLNTLSLMCLGFNLSMNVLGFISTKLTSGFIYGVILLGNITLPVLISLSGVVLGLASLFMKEKTALKSIIAVLLNIIYIRLWFFVWSNM